MPTKVMQKISGLLETRPEPVSRNTIITETGGRAEVARKAIDHLVRLGYVTESAGARGAKLIESTRPFTVLEWENEASEPTSSHLVPPSPGPGHDTSSHLVPPLRGDGTGWTHSDEPTSSRYDWVDELAPANHPPGDLHDNNDIDLDFR